MPSIRNEWNYVDINFPFIFVKFFGFLSARLHVVCTFTSKMANLWNNKKAILDIIDNSESDAESIFSGDSSNYDPDSEVKLKMKMLVHPNKTDDDEESDDTDESMPSADGWRKYRSHPDFVRFNFTAQSGFKPPNPAPNEVREFFMLFISIILNSVT